LQLALRGRPGTELFTIACRELTVVRHVQRHMLRTYGLLLILLLTGCHSPSQPIPRQPQTTSSISEYQAINIAQRALEDAGWGEVDESELDASLLPSDNRPLWRVHWISPGAPAGGPVGDVYIDAQSGQVISCNAAGTC